MAPDLSGRIIAARREALNLTQADVIDEIIAGDGDHEDRQSMIRWLQRIETGEEYHGRTAPTRHRYRRLLEILGLERDEPTFELLAGEVAELSSRLEALRALMLTVLERLDSPKTR